MIWVFALILYFMPLRVVCLFEMCNHKVELKAGEKIYVNSPYYPGEYPIGSSCRYVIKAPQDYKLQLTCNIKLNTPHSATKCLNEVFYFNREGSEVQTESEFFCGTGKMERKSFLNQAVLSYISTPSYKRTLINVIKDIEENIQMNKTKNKIEMKIQKQQQQPKIKTTTKTPTTVKAIKVQHLATSIATTSTTPINVLNSLLTTSFVPTLSSTTSLPTSSTTEENLKVQHNMNMDKKVSNSFAYVVAFLSNTIDREALAKTAATTTSSSTTKSPKITTTKATTSRPTSVSNYNNFLPASTWPNGSIGTHKISTKRATKLVVVSQDYASSIQNIRSSEGGGLFSCLVEALEPQCDCGWSSTIKITGPAGVAGINEFPSMAGIMTIKNHKIFCGATIIHHRYLLSAAHCFITPETNTPEYLTAVVGEHDLSTVLDSFYTRQYDLVKIILHEHFEATSARVHNDIALLKTSFSIEWNRSVGPACLPFYAPPYRRAIIPHAGQRLVTAGWGTTTFGGQQSSLLLKATLDVISHTECQIIVKNLPFEAFCTYTPGLDTCQYDSGGALYVRGERLYAVGIVSYGYACATTQPSVNTRISSYLKWITTKTPEVTYCNK